MKNPLLFFIFSACIIFSICGCNKNANNYAIIDHTQGMASMRTWTGYAYGNAIGDTLWDTVRVVWPEYYYRTIDTNFSIVKINAFSVNVAGAILEYRSTDSILHIVRFDSTYVNSATSVLLYDYIVDTMRFEFHKILGYNDTAMKYYENNMILHSPAP